MKQDTNSFNLRPAVKKDIEFLFQLRSTTMRPFFENTHGWIDTEEYLKASDELGNAKVVMVGDEDIGIIKVIPKTNELHLHQMQIKPEFQKMGIGAKLLSKTISQSETLQIPITLYVITSSPAKRLYDSFGFVVSIKYEHHCKMCRQPAKLSYK
ncbi:MAG: GNAT family N-acetyltransferase [Proteobacteria bacterium]|nr:GNAT family N-acetyltransferase [Pseudomonadota bacterium]